MGHLCTSHQRQQRFGKAGLPGEAPPCRRVYLLRRDIGVHSGQRFLCGGLHLRGRSGGIQRQVAADGVQRLRSKGFLRLAGCEVAQQQRSLRRCIRRDGCQPHLVRDDLIRCHHAENARIWIDGRQVGTGRYRQKLEYGTHTIECSLDNHRTTIETITVTPDTPEFISLLNPTPILGTLKVNNASGPAEVYIGGSRVGSTPYTTELLVGAHEIVLKKDGYNSQKVSVNVQENEVSYVNAELDRNMNVKISSTPDATLFLDGKRVGETPNQVSLQAGRHQVMLTRNGYLNKKAKINVTHQNQVFSYKLKKAMYDSPVYIDMGAGLTTGSDELTWDIFAAYHPLEVLDKMFLGFEYSQSLKDQEDAIQTTVMTIYTGYDIPVGAACKITPTLGAAMRTYLDTEGTSYLMKAGIKFSLAFTKGMELYFKPQFYQSLQTSEYHVGPEYLSSDSGFRFSFGLSLYL